MNMRATIERDIPNNHINSFYFVVNVFSMVVCECACVYYDDDTANYFSDKIDNNSMKKKINNKYAK